MRTRMGLWDEQDGFFYDVLSAPDGRVVPLRVRSMVGLLPLCATTTLGSETLARLPRVRRALPLVRGEPAGGRGGRGQTHTHHGAEGRLLAMVGPEQLQRILAPMLDEAEFLSPHGLRSRLAAAPGRSRSCSTCPSCTRHVDYEPAESTTGLFGGNSNWRGPVWFPVNVLVIEALRRLRGVLRRRPDRRAPDRLRDPVHARAGRRRPGGPAGRAVPARRGTAAGPCSAAYALFQDDPRWRDQLLFHEYFHGDTGAGLGASHQTGWTGLVAS